MHVKVISRRLFRMAQRDKLIPLLKDLRGLAQQQKGFVSRYTYSNLNDPGEYIVVSEWETADDWIEWMDLQEVKEVQWEIDSLIGEKTFFDVYRPEEY